MYIQKGCSSLSMVAVPYKPHLYEEAPNAASYVR